MAERTEIRLSGSGGQGLILASIILAEAATAAGKFVTQSQSYGPEARGGKCKAEVVISDKEILFPKVRKPGFLLALTQDALDSYAAGIPDNCVVMVDEGLRIPSSISNNKVIMVPILRAAEEKVGKSMTANIVAVAAVNHVLSIASDEQLEEAVMQHIPKGAEEINRKALKVGMDMINNY